MIKGKNTAPTSDGVVGALAVVATLYGLIFVALHNGPCMNPAVAVSFTLLEVSATPNRNNVYSHYLYAYTLAPALGGILAGLFAICHRKKHETHAENDDSVMEYAAKHTIN